MFEPLEVRSLLAGNVLVNVSAEGLLTVTGDDADNRVYITQLPATGPTTPWPGARYLIACTYTPPRESPTTVNGETSVVVEGVKNIDIAMNDGFDFLYIHNPSRPLSHATLPGDVTIDMGASSSDVDQTDLYPGDDLRLFGENHKQITIHLGTGADSLDMHAVVNQLTVLGDPTWKPGDPVWQPGDPPPPPGDDAMTFVGLKANGPVLVDTKYGNDTVYFTNDTRYEEATGIPRGTVTTNAKATLTVFTGSGKDKVDLWGGAHLSGALRIDTGDGNDNVLVDKVHVATYVSMALGRGHDFVQFQLSDAVFQKVAVWFGEGDDGVNVLDLQSLETLLYGQEGNDTLSTYADHPSDLGDELTDSFEVVEEK